MKDYRQVVAEDVRLIMLRALSDENDYRLNEALLERVLESFGHRRSREYIRDQLRWLSEMEAVTTSEVGSVVIAEITRKGLDHVDRKIVIEGVARPSPGG